MQWVKPELVGLIRFVEWTAEGRLGVPRFSASAVIKALATSGGKTPSVRLFLAFLIFALRLGRARAYRSGYL